MSSISLHKKESDLWQEGGTVEERKWGKKEGPVDWHTGSIRGRGSSSYTRGNPFPPTNSNTFSLSLFQVNPLTKSFILSTIPNAIRDSSSRRKITKMSFSLSLSLARKLEIDLCAWINIHMRKMKKRRKYYCRERRILTWFISILVLCLSWFMEKEDNLLLPLTPHIWQLVERERERERETNCPPV